MGDRGVLLALRDKLPGGVTLVRAADGADLALRVNIPKPQPREALEGWVLTQMATSGIMQSGSATPDSAKAITFVASLLAGARQSGDGGTAAKWRHMLCSPRGQLIEADGTSRDIPPVARAALFLFVRCFAFQQVRPDPLCQSGLRHWPRPSHVRAFSPYPAQAMLSPAFEADPSLLVDLESFVIDPWVVSYIPPPPLKDSAPAPGRTRNQLVGVVSDARAAAIASMPEAPRRAVDALRGLVTGLMMDFFGAASDAPVLDFVVHVDENTARFSPRFVS
jgi:hypothetical protein